MKLPALPSTTQRATPESVARAQHAATEPARRVEAAEGVAADRQRSLQQELDEVEAAALAEFDGQALIQDEAHALAERLARDGLPEGLLRTDVLLRQRPAVDDEA
jgi:hypothetical protein